MEMAVEDEKGKWADGKSENESESWYGGRSSQT